MAGAPDKVEVFPRRALARAPHFDGAASKLGFALLLRGKAEEAAAVLEPVVDADPANLDVRTNLASAA
jgi:Flp pilus assembly protein TadD